MTLHHIAPAMLARIFDPHARGYHTIYRQREANPCPGCGRTHWLIGRTTAECAFCATAIPLEAGYGRADMRPVIVHRNMNRDLGRAA
jgi:hypothetical protein